MGARCFFSVLFTMLSFSLLGQDITDAVLKEASDLAAKGQYEQALLLLEKKEPNSPANAEWQVMRGRIYSWKRDFKDAESILKPLAERQPPHYDAMAALINTLYWSDQYRDCLLWIDRYLEQFPKDSGILLTKARVLEKLDEDEEALKILNNSLKDPKISSETEGLRQLIIRKKKNHVSLSYLNITTANPGIEPAHYGYVEYGRRIKKSSLIGRIHGGSLNGESSLLVESDFYTKTSSKSYIYLNAGVSDGKAVFPKSRAAAEFYLSPNRIWDFSVGSRLLDFETDDVILLTGHAAFNIHDWNISYRPFYDLNNSLFSHVLGIQRRDESKERLLRMELQYGTVPYLLLYSNLKQLQAWRAGIQYEFPVVSSLTLRPIFLYEYEEYLPDSYRHRFNLQLIINKRF